MSLKDVSAKLSDDGLKLLLNKDDKTLAELDVGYATDAHRNFIISTWVKSISPDFGVHRSIHNAMEAELAEVNWDKSIVVTSGDDRFTVHAWMCVAVDPHDINSAVLLQAYVQPDLRQKCVLKAMIEDLGGEKIVYPRQLPNNLTWSTTANKWTYNPYLLGKFLRR